MSWRAISARHWDEEVDPGRVGPGHPPSRALPRGWWWRRRGGRRMWRRWSAGPPATGGVESGRIGAQESPDCSQKQMIQSDSSNGLQKSGLMDASDSVVTPPCPAAAHRAAPRRTPPRAATSGGRRLLARALRWPQTDPAPKVSRKYQTKISDENIASLCP